MVRPFYGRSEANGSEPGRKSIDGVMWKVGNCREIKGWAEVLDGDLWWMAHARGDGGNVGGLHGKRWRSLRGCPTWLSKGAHDG